MKGVTYTPPDSTVVGRIRRAIPSKELCERARATSLFQQERKFDVVVVFYTLSFGFSAGSDRSIQAFLDRYIEMAYCGGLSYAEFHEWFEPGFVVLLREILDDAIKNFDTGREDLNERLERLRDVLIADATILSLYQDAADVYAATRDDQAGLKHHLAVSLSTGLPTRFRTTDGKTHEQSQLPTDKWVAGALVLLDLSIYDF